MLFSKECKFPQVYVQHLQNYLNKTFLAATTLLKYNVREHSVSKLIFLFGSDTTLPYVSQRQRPYLHH